MKKRSVTTDATPQTRADTDIPEGWASTTMGKIATVIGGGTPKASDPSNFAAEGHAWLTPADLSAFDGIYITRGKRDLSDKGLSSSSARVMPAGAVLMSSRAPIGYVALAANTVSTNQGFKNFICHDGIDPQFVFYWLKYKRDDIEGMGSGSTFTEISGSRCKEIPITIAPLAEQKRIVAKVEELLARVSAARDQLATVPAILKRFRQSVLAAACSGRLTEEWRAAHQVSRLPNPSNDPELSGIPESWSWKALNRVCKKITDGEHLTPPPCQWGVPLLSAKDVREDMLDFSTTKFVGAETAAKSRARCDPERGDVLVVSRGATVGRTCLVRVDTVFCLMGSVLLFKPDRILAAPEWIECFFKSPQGLTALTSRSGSTAQQAIYIKDMREYPIVLPPLAEQREIVRRVDKLFALADAVEKRVAAGTARAEKLTQSILAKAFRGELVPTEAELAQQEGRHYESAAGLLESIRVTRTDGASVPRGRKAGAC